MSTATHARHRAAPHHLDDMPRFESWKPVLLLAAVAAPFIAVGVWSWVTILTT